MWRQDRWTRKVSMTWAALTNFEIDQMVLIWNLRDGPKWLHGIVVEKLGPVSYQVEVQGQLWSRHVDQLLYYFKGVLDPEYTAISDPCAKVTNQSLVADADVAEGSYDSLPQLYPPHHSLVIVLLASWFLSLPVNLIIPVGWLRKPTERLWLTFLTRLEEF